MATSDPTKLLDQLQTEVNRVLEQTARVFSAASKNSKTNSTAQASKLKSLLPESVYRFHDALDQLEDELRSAKLVMRRDLALCRNASAAPPVEPTEATSSTTASSMTISADKMDNVAEQQSQPSSTGSNQDVSMQDFATQPATGDSTQESSLPTSGPEKDEASKPQANSSEQSKPRDLNVITEGASSQTLPDTATSQPPSSAPAAAEENKAPDTALTSRTTDLDSLFGPNSAGGAGGGDFTNADDAFDFNFSNTNTGADNNASNNDNDADFESFLPGLQDYAKGPDGDNGVVDTTDLDALFSDFAVPDAGSKDADGQGQGQGQQQEGDSAMRDTTFEELMDFADFGAGTGGEGGDQGEFDFDFS